MATPWKNLFESADYSKLALSLTPTRVYRTFDPNTVTPNDTVLVQDNGNGTVYQHIIRGVKDHLQVTDFVANTPNYTTNTEQKDCKSCGAPRRGTECEYCNRRF